MSVETIVTDEHSEPGEAEHVWIQTDAANRVIAMHLRVGDTWVRQWHRSDVDKPTHEQIARAVAAFRAKAITTDRGSIINLGSAIHAAVEAAMRKE